MNQTQRNLADDREAIRQQIYRYCRSMDRMDVALGRAIFHQDARVDYGAAIYRGDGWGFIDFVTEAHRAFDAHSHQVSNTIIDLAGVRAVSESYVTATLRSTRAGQAMVHVNCGRYLDRWSCRDGHWRIDERRYVHDFDEIRAVTETTGLPSEGRQQPDDPSYALFAPAPQSWGDTTSGREQDEGA